ncbi:hypothetical protein STEG23_003567 [Scotinomys teguina]
MDHENVVPRNLEYYSSAEKNEIMKFSALTTTAPMNHSIDHYGTHEPQHWPLRQNSPEGATAAFLYWYSDQTPRLALVCGQELMAGDRRKHCELDQEKYDIHDNVKIICLGDSAVGKSKLMERFLMDGFQSQQLSTYALTLYKHTAIVDGKTILVDFWDTAGQERFQSMHASYYHKAHACIMVFDVQRKITYKNLGTWYAELREFRPEIPCILVANKIDADTQMTQKNFSFAKKFSLPLYFVSAADGTNVVKLFNDAIRLAVAYKESSQDFMDEVLQELENFTLEQKEENTPDQEQSDMVKSPSPS